MSDVLTYLAAVRLLPDGKRRLLSVLNSAEATGSAVWAESVPAAADEPGALVSISDLTDEIVEFGRETLQRTSEWRTGVSRFIRSQRLAAAHVVHVVSSYFEAFAEGGLPADSERLAERDGGQTAVTEGKVPGRYAGITEFLRSEPLPVPEPHRPYTDVRNRVAGCYEKLGDRLARFACAPAEWDDLDAARKDALRKAVRELTARALVRYGDGYRSLAAGNGEFGFWTASVGTACEPGVGLAGVASLLAETAIRRPGQRARAPLALSSR